MFLLYVLLCSFGFSGAQECNYIQLVKCYMTVLDDWAIALWDNKDNVVTIDDNACEHLHAIGRCVDDQSDVTHYCTATEVIDSAQTITDLLTHRQGHSNFLWSYYLLKFSCSSRGRQILDEHRSCLRSDRIGRETLSATTYLINTLNKTSDDMACTVLSDKLTNFRQSLSDVCGGESPAAELLCESLKGHSMGVYPNKMASCNYQCNDNINEVEEVVSDPQLGTPQTLNGEPTSVPDPGAQAASSAASRLHISIYLILILVFLYKH